MTRSHAQSCSRRSLIAGGLTALLVPSRAVAVNPDVTVWKTPTCGCCGAWVAHMRAAGFSLTVNDVEQDDLEEVKRRLAVPQNLRSCHTASVAGYVVEGHVPATDIELMISYSPKIHGLAVPGMPLGSPGMEQGDREDRYEVLLFAHDKPPAIFARYPKSQDVLSK